MKNLYLLVAIFFVGCSINEEPNTIKPIELSQRVILLREPAVHIQNSSDYISALSLPHKATIKIIDGNGGYTVTKIKGISDIAPEINTRITTEVQIVENDLIVITITGPTKEEYVAEKYLLPACEDIYIVTDDRGKSIAFGIRDCYRVDMPDITDVMTIEERFLMELKKYDR